MQKVKFKFDPNATESNIKGVEAPAATDPAATSPTPATPAPEAKPEPKPEPTPQATAEPVLPSNTSVTSDGKLTQEPPAKEVTEKGPEITEQQFLEFYNKNNDTAFDSFSALQTGLTKEVVKEVVKAPEYDEETSAFLQFKKDTGRGINEWIEVQKDYSKHSDKDLAFNAIRQEYQGMDLSKNQLDILLAEKLKVEPDDLYDLDEPAKLKLSVIANKRKRELQELQNKYRSTKAEPGQLTEKSSSETNTQQPTAEQIEKFNQERQAYLQRNQAAVASLQTDSYEVEVDTPLGKEKVSLNYEFTDDDRQGMLSVTNSIDQIVPMFYDEKGQLDQKAFNLGMSWANPKFRDRMISVIVQQARAQGIESVMRKQNNINFNRQTKPTQPTENDGYGQIDTEHVGGMSVKFPFNT